jgi:hypothetical protein
MDVLEVRTASIVRVICLLERDYTAQYPKGLPTIFVLAAVRNLKSHK